MIAMVGNLHRAAAFASDVGWKAIYVNRMMNVGIVDMPPEKSEPLLADQRPLCCRTTIKGTTALMSAHDACD